MQQIVETGSHVPDDIDRHAPARGRYLELAVGMARGPAADEPTRHFAVSHVSIAAVADAAGVSRAALYRLWPSQQDFWNELIAFVVRGDADALACTAVASTDVAAQEALLDAAQEALLADPLPLLRAAIVGYPDRTAPFAAVRQAHLDLVGEHAARWLRANDRRCVPGVSTTELAAAATALGHGIAVTGRMCDAPEVRFDAAAFEPGPAGPRSVLGVATRAVYQALTEDAGQAVPPVVGPSAGDDTVRATIDAPTGRPRDYLSIAAELVVTGGRANVAMGHINLERVARAAGVTRRSLSKIWTDQTRFRLDLFSHLFGAERSALIGAVESAGQVAARSRLDARDAFRRVGNDVDTRIRRGESGSSFLAFAPQLADYRFLQCATIEQRRYLNHCGAELRLLLARVRRRPLPGVSTRQLAVLLAVLADGFERLIRTNPDAVRTAVPTATGDVSLPGLAVGAVLDQLTTPVSVTPAGGQYAFLVA